MTQKQVRAELEAAITKSGQQPHLWNTTDAMVWAWQAAQASAQQVVPEGFALAPLAPTPEMLEAALKLTADMAMDDDEPYHCEIYCAMVAAAAQPVTQKGPQ